jgi:hypothetical protein
MREIKANFSITGEYIVNLFAEDWEAPNKESVNRKIVMQKIDKKLKEKGIDAFDFQMAIRVREQEVEEVNPVNDNFAELEEPPF